MDESLAMVYLETTFTVSGSRDTDKMNPLDPVIWQKAFFRSIDFAKFLL